MLEIAANTVKTSTRPSSIITEDMICCEIVKSENSVPVIVAESNGPIFASDAAAAGTEVSSGRPEAPSAIIPPDNASV